jgi:hypothetical protein
MPNQWLSADSSKLIAVQYTLKLRRHLPGRAPLPTQILYHTPMPREPKPSRPLTTLLRAVIEIGFIIFLFYSNLLMGEFNRSAGQGKTLTLALTDIFTLPNFLIANIAALIGYVVFEFLRRKL